MEIQVPDGLPTLSGGGHTPYSGKACFMEYASLLAGEEWSDHPACTHPVIAEMARSINDCLPDDRRHEIAELIPSVIGTADTREDPHERKVLSVRLAVWCARQVLPLVREQDKSACEAAVAAAEGWCDGTATEAEARSAANAAYAAAAAANAAYAANAANAAYAYAAYAAAYAAANANAAYAAAYAYANAYAAAYAYANAYAAAYANAAADLPALLRGLIAEHARLTGHTVEPEVQEVWESADFTSLVKAAHV